MRQIAYGIMAACAAATLAGAVAAGPNHDRTDNRGRAHTHGHAITHANTQEVQRHAHRHSVGHGFDRRHVVVVNDWHRRGLRQPGPDEVYVVSGKDIYLAAASTLIVKALID